MANLFCSTTIFGLMLLSLEKTTWKQSIEKSYPTRHIVKTLLRSTNISTDNCCITLVEQHFTSYGRFKNWVDLWIASKDESFFRRKISMLPERWKKLEIDNTINIKCLISFSQYSCFAELVSYSVLSNFEGHFIKNYSTEIKSKIIF